MSGPPPPSSGRPARTSARAAQPARVAASSPLSDAERDELESLLDRVPAPFEPLDAGMLDGFLCGVLVQPRRIPATAWLRHVTDVDGRALPSGYDMGRLHALAERRHAELDAAIGRRAWFDPWVFELVSEPEGESAEVDDHEEDDEDDEDDDFDPGATEAVYPWVAGFATALELFPDLMTRDAKALTEPLTLLYRHLGPDDLEDADELLAEIETLEPPADLSEAVEGLVRATLLLADIGRPLPAADSRQARGSAPPSPSRRRGRPLDR